jgi:hypothetical protein
MNERKIKIGAPRRDGHPSDVNDADPMPASAEHRNLITR